MSSPHIDLKGLQAFHLVARLGSMRLAAAQLSLTVSAVSIRLRRLEDELGVPLFERVGKRLILTRSGEHFLAKISHVFEALNEAVASIAGNAGIRERVVLGIVNDMATRFMDPIADFIRARSDVELVLRVRRSREILALVLEGEADLGMGYFGKMPAELDKVMLSQTGFSLLCHSEHPLARLDHPPALAEIAQYRLIGLRPDSDMGRRISRAFSAAGLAEPVLIEAGGCRGARDFAERKVGVAVVHAACLHGGLPPTLRSIDATAYFGAVDIAMIHRRAQSLSPAHTALLGTLSFEPE